MKGTNVGDSLVLVRSSLQICRPFDVVSNGKGLEKIVGQQNMFRCNPLSHHKRNEETVCFYEKR